MTLTKRHPPTHARGDGGFARKLTLIGVCAATFMLLVDLMVVQVALPTIQRQVGGSFTDFSGSSMPML